MGWVLLIALVGVESSLLVASLAADRHHRRLRAGVRISLFAGFVLLVVAGVLDWGPRYYALGALLLVLALVGVIALLRPRSEGAAPRIVPRFLGMVLLISLATAPAIVFPQYSPPQTTGPYAVTGALETLTDTDRTETFGVGGPRKITVEYWHPDTNEGAYPLVVFSHGATGIRSSNESLFRELASHGYFVASIDHTYHALYTTDAEGKTTRIDAGYLRDLRDEDASADPAGSLEFYREWTGLRTADIDFVIDHVRQAAAVSEASNAFGLVDADRIGVMGHSLGGAAAVGVGRQRDDVDAVIALESPFMTEIAGADAGGFVWNGERYPVPLLSIYSDSAWDHLNEWPQYAQNYRQLIAPDPDVFSEHLAGVGHLGLTDLSLTSPILTRILDGVPSEAPAAENLAELNVLCLAFLDAYLKDAGPFTP